MLWSTTTYPQLPASSSGWGSAVSDVFKDCNCRHNDKLQSFWVSSSIVIHSEPICPAHEEATSYWFTIVMWALSKNPSFFGCQSAGWQEALRRDFSRAGLLDQWWQVPVCTKGSPSAGARKSSPLVHTKLITSPGVERILDSLSTKPMLGDDQRRSTTGRFSA